MRKLRVYIDTSVIGGCFDEEFKEWSNRLFEEFITEKKIPVISKVTFEELDGAPQDVKDVINNLPKKVIEYIQEDKEAETLALKYIDSKAISKRFIGDALHIAYATVAKVDILVSWNFKHVVNINRIKKYNAINLMEGYSLLEIRNPKEAIDYD